ncbi:MAG: glycosyltransferase family 2 protein [Okeania sp. SIO2C2]|uniref:glycosyltransferase family 2 protein n=1 Tax=Okeania sp. SIO2C2 TaxID=2607787 RepID=UPI0013BA5099|nr:glycosyltransferase family 2 protein [Okeania sp. SIO2C2]NEP85376.1 glycosyltransferase family 2 protein [Okeania sp. SIO2C2]
MLSEEKKVQLSIVVPFYNEEPNIDYLFERLISVLKPLEMTYEIICINDGSQDNTLKLLVEYHQRNSLIKVVNFSRNFGKEIAITAGIDYTVGDAVIPIDADLQDPPELIVEMIAKWREGYDVVYATRRSRQGESWIKKFTAQRFYRTIQRLTPVEIPPDTGDFRLMDRKVVEALKKLPETNRFMKGLFSWVGYQQTSILYDRDLRFKGETKWNYWQLWNLAIEGITAFSSIPLKIWSYIGISISLISFIYASFLVIRTLIFGIDVPGYASLIVAILFLGGMQLLSLGILGEYLGRVHEEVKRRPLYLVRESYGFENQMTRSE